MTLRVSSRLVALALLAITSGAAAADGPTVSQAWARATAPGVDVGAVYLSIDGGATDDSLVTGQLRAGCHGAPAHRRGIRSALRRCARWKASTCRRASA